VQPLTARPPIHARMPAGYDAHDDLDHGDAHRVIRTAIDRPNVRYTRLTRPCHSADVAPGDGQGRAHDDRSQGRRRALAAVAQRESCSQGYHFVKSGTTLAGTSKPA
jgi:hypothetical protein